MFGSKNGEKIIGMLFLSGSVLSDLQRIARDPRGLTNPIFLMIVSLLLLKKVALSPRGMEALFLWKPG